MSNSVWASKVDINFADISEIHTQESEKTISEDTQARADELEEYESHHDRRISVLFVLIIMIGYQFRQELLKSVRFRFHLKNVFLKIKSKLKKLNSGYS